MKTETKQQTITNAALVCAYIYGNLGGWLGLARGSASGFRCDYMVLSDSPGNLAQHKIYRFLVAGNECELESLEEARDAVAEAHGERPEVVTLTAAYIEAAKATVREAIASEKPADLATWLFECCAGIRAEWELVAAAL